MEDVDYGAYNTDLTTQTEVMTGPAATAYNVFVLALFVLMVASYWKMFEKAGEAGWKALIPIYNLIVLLKIINRPWWWLLLLFIPLVNIVVAIILTLDTGKAYGKGGVWSFFLLLILPFIGYPMLAFGDAKYKLPARS